MNAEFLEQIENIKKIKYEKTLLSEEILSEKNSNEIEKNSYEYSEKTDQNHVDYILQKVKNSALKYIDKPYIPSNRFVLKDIFPELEIFLIYLVLVIFSKFDGKRNYEIIEFFFKSKFTKYIMEINTEFIDPKSILTHDRIYHRIRHIQKNPRISMLFLLKHKYLHYYIDYFGNIAAKSYENKIKKNLLWKDFPFKVKKNDEKMCNNDNDDNNDYDSSISDDSNLNLNFNQIQTQNEDYLNLNENIYFSTSDELEFLFKENGY